MTAAGSPNETRSYSYDGAGRRTGMVDITGTTTFAFDQVGRLTEVVSPAGTVEYAYNAAGERTSMTQPEGSVSYAYDLNGYLTTLTDWRTDTITMTNDADGRTIGVERSNGVDTPTNYDAAGRLDEIAHTSPTGDIDTFTYTLDPNGNRTQVDSAAGSESYVLDEMNRLTGVSYSDGTSETFGYDDQGNRTSFTDRDGNNVTYLLDDAGQLISDSSGVTYTYDQAGNLTATSDGDTYTWDDYGRLIEANTNSVTQTYGYDATDTRTNVDGEAQLWDRNGLPTLVETADDTYVHAGSQVARSGDDWLLADAVGSIRTTTDTTGDVTGTTNFTAYGEPLDTTGTFGFAGEQQDPTGLQHLRARQYNPAIGRFLSVDPVQPGAPGTTGWGLYSYAGNNPTTWTDPTGQMTERALLERNTAQRTPEAAAPTGKGVSWVLIVVGIALTGGIAACLIEYCEASIDPGKNQGPNVQPQPPQPEVSQPTSPTTEAQPQADGAGANDGIGSGPCSASSLAEEVRSILDSAELEELRQAHRTGTQKRVVLPSGISIEYIPAYSDFAANSFAFTAGPNGFVLLPNAFDSGPDDLVRTLAQELFRIRCQTRESSEGTGQLTEEAEAAREAIFEYGRSKGFW